MNMFTVNYSKDENKEKEDGNGPSFKKTKSYLMNNFRPKITR